MTPEQVHHAYAHETHAAELRSEAAEFRRAAGLRTGLRTRLGLTLVTLGTRLAAQSVPDPTRLPGAVAAR
ncbi:hypothetical protein ACFW9D_14975 [Streptomyces sp. NPDC059524]|uniref:hypothetical protein n=1 Tax=Streptomyces sp. NPDC059524 TaxID=3346856 RepID=UPI003681DFC0